MQTRVQQRQAAELFTTQLIASWTVSDTSTQNERAAKTPSTNSESSQNTNSFQWAEITETSTPINRGQAAKLEETVTEELLFLGSDEVLLLTDRAAAAIHFLDNLPIYQTSEQRELNIPVVYQRRYAACNAAIITAEDADQDNKHFCDYLCRLLGSYKRFKVPVLMSKS
jgi:hypothetical protein